MQRSAALFFICSLLLIHISPARGRENAQVRILTSEYPPYNYTEAGEPKGFCTEIVLEILNRTGTTAPITTLPWARAYQTALKQPNTLIYTIARRPERENLFHWIGILIHGRQNSYLFSLKSNPVYLASLEDAASHTIGATLNGARARFLTDHGMTNLDLVIHTQMNAVKLINQRITLWAEDELAAVYSVRQLGKDPNEVLKKSLRLGFFTDGYLAFSKDTSPALVEKFKSALARAIESEQYKTIKKKYILDYGV